MRLDVDKSDYFYNFDLEMLSKGVYFMLKGSLVVYIGKSQCISSRISEHMYGDNKKLPGKQYDKIKYLKLNKISKKNLKIVEEAFIKLFKPKYNRESFLKEKHITQGEINIIKECCDIDLLEYI